MKKILLIILLYTASFSVYSQSIELNLKSFYGIWNNETSGYNYGGGGLELLYEQPLRKGALRTGVEFRSIDWGNQLSLLIAYKSPYIQQEKWQLSGISSVGVGLALFRDNPLFVWSIGYMPAFTWLGKKRVSWDIGLGFRYTDSPAYKDYGKINRVVDFPFKIGSNSFYNWNVR